MIDLLLIFGGMAVLVAGAEGLVRGASRIAVALGVSPLVVGLTVVAFGTSAPELAVSVGAALSGSGEVAIGNAIGSNAFNTLAILGIAALFGGLVVHQRIVRIDVPLLILVTAVVWALAADGRLSMIEGIVLLLALTAYTGFSYLAGRRETPAVEAEYDEAFGIDPATARQGIGRSGGLVAIGLVGLVVGAQLLVTGATALAERFGVADLVIGLTVVAIGTSLPELATSVVAARRGERDIAVGNVVGSNLFNLLGVLGATALAGGGIDIPEVVLRTDLPVAVLITLIALPALAIGLRIDRWEGAVLLTAYVGYTAYLVLSSDGGTPMLRVVLLAGMAAVAVLVLGIGLLLGRDGPSKSDGGDRPEHRVPDQTDR